MLPSTLFFMCLILASIVTFHPTGLLKHFTPLVMSDRQKRQEAHLPSQPLSPLVYLYNAVLAHLTARATRRELQHIQWPPPEFKPPLKFTPGRLPPLYWNSAVYLENIHQCLTQLVMPGGGGRGEEEEEGWSRQCARCMEYVSAVIASRGEEEGQECIPLYSRQVKKPQKCFQSFNVFFPTVSSLFSCNIR